MNYILDHVTNPMGTFEDRGAITFIVSDLGEIIWSYCLCRHKALRLSRNKAFGQIEWGGVLEANGDWRRPSFDHGDCEILIERKAVLELLVKEATGV
jgi:hypothetical protein